MKKILIARFNHETNTFSPVATPLSAFAPCYGEAALYDQRGARTAMGAFIALTEALPDTVLITPVSATANPSGTVTADAYSAISDCILQAVRAADGIDAILLDLHGALVAENAADGEGTLLEKIRQLAPDTPLAVALDLHGNVTEKMVHNADILVSFKTYPHVDMFETGLHAGRLLLDLLQKKSRPVTRWRQLPLLSHTLRSNTNEGAMQRAVAAARAAEQQPGVLAASVMAGFSLADFADAGMSVIVVAEGDPAIAQRTADQIAASIWQERDGFVYTSAPLADSLAHARALAAGSGSGPVLLLDHSDNVMSGGTCDTMDVLQAALAAGMTGIAVGPLCDPAAVETLWQAGEGATLALEIGNRIALTAQGILKQPQRLKGTVRVCCAGEFVVSGPIYTGAKVSMGRTVLFDTGSAKLVITEERMEPYDRGVFSCVGLDPAQQTYLLLKSRMYCRPVFVPISKGLVECDADSGGPTSSNYALFPFRQIRRPVAPLDVMPDVMPGASILVP